MKKHLFFFFAFFNLHQINCMEYYFDKNSNDENIFLLKEISVLNQKFWTDSELINFLPQEIWFKILDYLDFKKNKAILYFFAPRIGISEKNAKIVAVNISNIAALKSKNFNEWEDRINNFYKSWKSEKANKTKEIIKKYLRILNKEFLFYLSEFRLGTSLNDSKKFMQEFKEKIILDFLNKIEKNDNQTHKYSYENLYIDYKKLLLFTKFKVLFDDQGFMKIFTMGPILGCFLLMIGIISYEFLPIFLGLFLLGLLGPIFLVIWIPLFQKYRDKKDFIGIEPNQLLIIGANIRFGMNYSRLLENFEESSMEYLNQHLKEKII